MVATKNVVLAAAAAGAAVVQASNNPITSVVNAVGSAVGGVASAVGLKVRGTNNVFEERGKLPSHGPSLPAALTNIHRNCSSCCS
jgi:hypothetical protein